MEEMIPLVSIVTITYNHEKWIAKCIEGVLMQKTSFPIEMIIAEDCGPDGTRAVCEEYASKYPEIIRLLPSEHNLGPKENERRAMAEVRGKYIAFCEGDDFWTDPQKLQKQVDFLENNPDFSVCFTRWVNYNDVTSSEEGDGCSDLFNDGESGVEVDLDLFFKRWVTQPLTMVYRSDAIGLELYDRYKYYRDDHQIYHLLKAGRGYIMNFFGGLRIKHPGGMASMLSAKEYCEISLSKDREFFKKTRNKWTKKTYIETLQESVEAFKQESKAKAFSYSIVLFFTNWKIKRLIRNIWSVIFS